MSQTCILWFKVLGYGTFMENACLGRAFLGVRLRLNGVLMGSCFLRFNSFYGFIAGFVRVVFKIFLYIRRYSFTSIQGSNSDASDKPCS